MKTLSTSDRAALGRYQSDVNTNMGAGVSTALMATGVGGLAFGGLRSGVAAVNSLRVGVSALGGRSGLSFAQRQMLNGIAKSGLGAAAGQATKALLQLSGAASVAVGGVGFVGSKTSFEARIGPVTVGGMANDEGQLRGWVQFGKAAPLKLRATGTYNFETGGWSAGGGASLSVGGQALTSGYVEGTSNGDVRATGLVVGTQTPASGVGINGEWSPW